MYVKLFAINTGGDRVYTEEEYKNQRELMKKRFPDPSPYEIDENGQNPAPINEQKEQEEQKIEKKNEQEYQNEQNENVKNIENNDEMNQMLEEKQSLILITQRQSLIIKLSNCLIVLMTILIIILFYLYNLEKNKNKNNFRIGDIDERKKLQVND